MKKDINGRYFFSLNRYERKKNINLAIHAFANLLSRHDVKDLKLVIAGGYDPKVAENKEHLIELQNLAK
jgi:alpha-1,3/alpha-1,6-mannosyltransferase